MLRHANNQSNKPLISCNRNITWRNSVLYLRDFYFNLICEKIIWKKCRTEKARNHHRPARNLPRAPRLLSPKKHQQPVCAEFWLVACIHSFARCLKFVQVTTADSVHCKWKSFSLNRSDHIIYAESYVNDNGVLYLLSYTGITWLVNDPLLFVCVRIMRLRTILIDPICFCFVFRINKQFLYEWRSSVQNLHSERMALKSGNYKYNK